MISLLIPTYKSTNTQHQPDRSIKHIRDIFFNIICTIIVYIKSFVIVCHKRPLFKNINYTLIYFAKLLQFFHRQFSYYFYYMYFLLILTIIGYLNSLILNNKWRQ